MGTGTKRSNTRVGYTGNVCITPWHTTKLYRKLIGDKLIFEGGVDNQHTLAFGTMEEVRQEVRDNLRILGAGGGYILGACHNIQVVSPPENIVAMYETGYEEGWF